MHHTESTPIGRPALRSPARDASRVLDALFLALSSADGSTLLSEICDGTVTGAALAAKRGWTREKVSKFGRGLRRADLIEARREGVFVRFLPVQTGFEVLAAWADGLPPIEPRLDLAQLANKTQRLRTRSMRTATARKLLQRVYDAPERTQGDLAWECGLSQPVTSRTLARLVDGGLVQRRRHGREVRYTADAEGLQRLHQWISASRRRLATGRIVAAAQDLSDQRLTAHAPDQVAPDVSAAALPHHDDDTPSPAPPSAAAEEDSASISTAASDGGEAMAEPAPRPSLAAPGPSLAPARRSTPPPAPPPAARKVPHTLEPEYIRPGECFRDRSGGEIRVLSFYYGELRYLHRPRGEQAVEKRSPRYSLAATLAEALASVSF